MKGCAKDISGEELRLWLKDKLPDLEKIRNEERTSWRHNMFRDGPPKKRASLKYQHWSLRLTAEQQETIPKFLVQHYCPSDMKLFTYVMDVLVPEAVVSLLMDIHDIGREEAEELMNTLPKEPVQQQIINESEDDVEEDVIVVNETDSDGARPNYTTGGHERKQMQQCGSVSRVKGKGHCRKPTTTELIQRGKEIQKALKRKNKSTTADEMPHKLRKEEDEYVTVSVCLMRRNRKMTYTPVRDYKDVSVCRSVCYTDLAEHAADALGIEANQAGKVLALFRVSGTVISEGSGKAPMWTLGKWLRTLHKAPTAIKLGLGLIPRKQHNPGPPVVSAPGPSSQLTTTNTIAIGVKVMYAQEMGSSEETRSHLCSLQGASDGSDTFIPEEHGYKVVRIVRGPQDILSPDTCKGYLKVFNADEDVFSVAYQSPTIVSVKSFKQPATLYCVPSIHDDKTSYEWMKLGSTQSYEDAPVIYVREEGVFKCQVTHDSGVTASEAIRVEMLPDDSERLNSDEVTSGIAIDNSPETSPITVEVQTSPTVLEYQGGVMQFSATQLADASHNFQSLIGEGAYGKVYRGNIHNCASVAIKVLSQKGESAIKHCVDEPVSPQQQMETEILTLSRFRHPNLVSLMGYCLSPPALVYEYLSNGSLFDNLHNLKERTPLTWKQRTSILHDACLGMVYLHTAYPPLLHQDIKSMNILVDERYNAKLGDFGFAVELPRVSCGRTMFTANFVARSEGYYAAEISAGKYSDRSDVYSFGIVVLEAFTGQRVFVSSRDDGKLIDHLADDLSSSETFKKVADPKAGPVADHICSMLWDITMRCTTRHSKRASSSEVLGLWRGI